MSDQIKKAAFCIGSKFIFNEIANVAIGAGAALGTGQVEFLTLFAIFRTGSKGVSDPMRQAFPDNLA